MEEHRCSAAATAAAATATGFIAITGDIVAIVLAGFIAKLVIVHPIEAIATATAIGSFEKPESGKLTNPNSRDFPHTR